MGGTGVIDRFLEVFTRYIDSGFGLLNGEVAFLATTLVAIDITLAAIFWSWAADEDIIARLAKKTLFVGVFAYLIGNWNNLARIVFESFAGLGLKASGTGLSTADLLSPGRIAQVGIDAGRPILDSISGLMGYISFFENFIQIAVLLFAWIVVLLAFFILAIQLFVTLIEFKLTTLAGFVLIPFGLFGKTAFAAERVLGNVISSGVKVLVLAVIVGIGSTMFSQFTAGFGGNQPTIEDAMALVLGGSGSAWSWHLRSWNCQRHRLRRSAARRRRSSRDWLGCGRHRCRRSGRCRHGSRGRGRRARWCRARRCVRYCRCVHSLPSGRNCRSGAIRRFNHCRFVAPIRRRGGIGSRARASVAIPGRATGLGDAHETLAGREPRRICRKPMRSAPPTMAAVALPSISPKVNADVQAIFRALRPHTSARNSLSEGGTSLGRAHRICAGPSQQLAADGLWLSAVVRRSRVGPRLAIRCAARSRHGWYRSIASVRRRPWHQPIAAIGRPIPRSPSISRALSKMYADCRPMASCCAKTGCGPMTSPPIGVPPRSTTTRAPTIPSPISASSRSPSRSPASSALRRTRFASPGFSGLTRMAA